MSGQLVFSLEAGNLAFHDAQLDYYGKRAAAACGAPVQPDESKGLPEGDYTVYIWDITDGQQQKVTAQLKGHEGPVWKVAWAHPQFGSLLATCSYDMKIIIWKEVNGQWQKAYVDSSHLASVNDVEFCPWEHGLRLACASSDGTVSVLTYVPQEAAWRRSVFTAHACGAQSVSWAPVVQREGSHPSMRLASGGCDNSVRIWKCDNDVWTQETGALMPSHSDWVREVAWRPDTSCNVVASGGWDKTVVIWKQEIEGQPWRQVHKIGCAGKVEGLAWSVTGSLLAVASDDGETVLYRESYDGRYEPVANCNEMGYTETAKVSSSPISAGIEVQQAHPGPNAQMDAQEAQQQQNVLDAFGM